MSYLAKLQAEKQLEGEPSKGSKAPSAPFDGSSPPHSRGLPPGVIEGIARLRLMDAPRRFGRCPAWREIVADAHRLAECGWAQQALALGWEPLQLWGWSPDRDGVAVWLAGAVPLFSERSCAVRCGPSSFRCMDRRPMDGAVPLWELGERR